MNRKFIGFLVWLVFVAGGLSLFYGILSKDETYTGTDLTFIVGDTKTMKIISPNVMKMEAADESFFAIRNGTDTLVGKPMPKPLGWSDNAYFTAELDKAPGGEWRIEKGSGVTIHLASDSSINVIVGMENGAKSTLQFLTLVIAFVLCVLGLILFW